MSSSPGGDVGERSGLPLSTGRVSFGRDRESSRGAVHHPQFVRSDQGHQPPAESSRECSHRPLHERFDRAPAGAVARRPRPAAPRPPARAEEALAVTLEDTTEIPFADHPLSDYFPGFDAEVNGTEVVAHLDTGGTFLHMGPDRAKALGIDLGLRSEAAYHGVQAVQSFAGIARTFTIGEALLENVPVVALASLVGQQDFIIFGTNILERFLATIDYRKEQLILSPSGDPELRKGHLAHLGTRATEVPFFLWGTHYMFARGRVGDRDDLNFFVDSGLVSLHPDGKGSVRRAAFRAAQADLEAWGLDPELVRKGVFESPVPLSLGPLQQTGLLFLAQGKPPVTSLGGVRIDGLLSHAFLRNTTWTLDFEKHRYLFHSGLP
ncbi:MAG: retropepsin-like aspartic protease [Planctomycetota bacterium]